GGSYRLAGRGARGIQQAALGGGGSGGQCLCGGHDRARAKVFAGGKIPAGVANAADGPGQAKGNVPRWRWQCGCGGAALFAGESFHAGWETGVAVGRAWDKRGTTRATACGGGEFARGNSRESSVRRNACKSLRSQPKVQSPKSKVNPS